jgi:hypothetical protein
MPLDEYDESSQPQLEDIDRCDRVRLAEAEVDYLTDKIAMLKARLYLARVMEALAERLRALQDRED